MADSFGSPPFSRLSPAPDWDANATAVFAILMTEDGRFLLQLRDDKPDITLPGHWACFGGKVEPGERPDAALRRELAEELAYDPPRIDWVYEAVLSLPRSHTRLVRFIWYSVPLPLAEIHHLHQQEGQDMRLFTLEQARALPKSSPLDVCAISLLVHHQSYYPSASGITPPKHHKDNHRDREA